MINRYVVADPHFHHEKTWAEFRHHLTGEPLRPFKSTTEMNVTLIENWNKTVTQYDRVYVLGDVVMGEDASILSFLNGRKILVGGNHDKNLKLLSPYFEEIYAVKEIDGVALTHVPVHPDMLKTRWRGNIHGHLHDRVVGSVHLTANLQEIIVPDHRYVCVSVEQTKFTPVPLNPILRAFPERKKSK